MSKRRRVWPPLGSAEAWVGATCALLTDTLRQVIVPADTEVFVTRIERGAFIAEARKCPECGIQPKFVLHHPQRRVPDNIRYVRHGDARPFSGMKQAPMDRLVAMGKAVELPASGVGLLATIIDDNGTVRVVPVAADLSGEEVLRRWIIDVGPDLGLAVRRAEDPPALDEIATHPIWEHLQTLVFERADTKWAMIRRPDGQGWSVRDSKFGASIVAALEGGLAWVSEKVRGSDD